MPRMFATLAVAVCIVGTGLVTAGSQANTPAQLPAPEPSISISTATVETYVSDDVQAAGSPPSPYIEASSAEDAEQKFQALEDGGAAARATSVKYGPCTLYPSVMYLRASSKYGAVGSKPYTKCTVPVSSIRHAADLRYKSFIWWKKAGPTTTGGNSGVASYT